MFGLPWFKKEEPVTTVHTSISTELPPMEGCTHAYDVSVYIPNGNGGFTLGTAQVFTSDEEEYDSYTSLGHMVADYHRSKGTFPTK